jgi:hypothetical protein
MRLFPPLLLVLLSAGSGWAIDDAVSHRSLRVLYVGNANTDRGRAYTKFLGEQFTLVRSADRTSFDPKSAAAADVVVLDWSQSDIVRPAAGNVSFSERDLKSPLGARSAWNKPTVLLGSAGHLLAAPWKVFGGSG